MFGRGNDPKETWRPERVLGGRFIINRASLGRKPIEGIQKPLGNVGDQQLANLANLPDHLESLVEI